ncbi:ribosomal protein s16 [Alternaria burnsii]|uniref:Ribosomal protein s16 n=1 Tax=Alternaria burnsii TaxID=1187904 RepID=A0A8H7AY85_9PLEO|nr:ribosomal protein s16 [Alternaria burnsii]KAF7672900.1 ribosomal protein s16 [Alternaria burnsii]
MVLRIRLARFGKKHAPFYNIVVAHARTARNSRPLEVLGTYDPKPQPPRPGDTHGRPWKDIKLDLSRARYWVGVGAQPSDTAWRLLSMVGILEPQYRVGKIAGMVVKSGSAAKSLIKEQNTAEAEPKVVVENMEGGTTETAA